ncbi:IclR family transcriptional regulator [Phenylobacterium sp.]|uniref:IclR family transcriptional regulator n=1 Tax=Phenylobacterium sp. TaxID=1871053 RepID=UPI00301D770E
MRPLRIPRKISIAARQGEQEVPIRPVEIALQLLELLSQHQPVGVSDLARLADLPKSTAQRALRVLEKSGWAEMTDPRRSVWSLTVRAVVASSRPTYEQARLRNLAVPVMEELRRATEETVHLSYRFRRSTFLLERLDGLKPARYFFPYGARSALHATASGKAILSAMTDAALDSYFDRPLAALTPTTVTDPELIRRDLAETRARGYSVTLGGNVADLHAIGAPIIGPQGHPIAALSVSMPRDRALPETVARFGPLVADAARRLGLGLGGLGAADQGDL